MIIESLIFTFSEISTRNVIGNLLKEEIMIRVLENSEYKI